MKKENLMQKIEAFLQADEINYEEAAAVLGKQALSPLKKMIASNTPLAKKAIELEKNIKLSMGDAKSTKVKDGPFSPGMRSITTNTPDEHLKGFAPDMKPRRRRL